MFVLPLIIFPLLSVGFGAMIAVLIGKAKEESPKVMIIGGEDSPGVLAGLKKVPKIQVVPLEANWKDEVINKQVPVVVEIPEGFERNLAGQKEQTVLIHDYEGDLKSEIAKDKIEKYFNEYRDSVIPMGISFAIANALQTKPIQAGEADTTLHIGFGAALSVFIMAVPLAVLFSSVLITISTFAKSYKEAQSYIMPLIFIVIIPAIAAMLPGVELTPKLALVPILNVSLLCKELVIGTYHWNYIAIIFASTCVYAAAALFLAIKMFQRESVLFRS